eukprot:TRINITY_DN20517_c0_g1_i1.p1 TRINITY_DN20517_c0_g1~~TRINITY_DN20517_c0_g1_i1.p1  ORF type:complete len:473 (+),score=100.92 TRINITY_DN20517_c0_g1_i1:37-1419(+)
MSAASEADNGAQSHPSIASQPAPPENVPSADPVAAENVPSEALDVPQPSEEGDDEPAAPTISPEEQMIRDLELSNYNLTIRLERREKECDTLRDEVADLTNQVVALKRDNERLELQLRDTSDATDSSELYDRIAELESRLRSAEAKPKAKRSSSTNPQHVARIKELEKELDQQKRASMVPSASSVSMSAELRKAQGEIAQLRAALLLAKQQPVQHSSVHSRVSQPRASSPAPEIPSNYNSRSSHTVARSSSPVVSSTPPFLPGDRVLAWWEPGMAMGPKGWGADAPGWYPAVVVPFQSNTHVAVDWGGGTAPSTVPRNNVRLQQLVDTPEEVAKLASQPYVESPRSQRNPRHESLRQSSTSMPRSQSPTPLYDALQSVGSMNDAASLANAIMKNKMGNTGTTSFSVIGQLTPAEAEEAARRILEWELVKEGSASPQRVSRGPSLSTSPRRTASPYARRYQ